MPKCLIIPGNRCNHLPKSPNFPVFHGEQSRPVSIKKLSTAIRSYYSKSRTHFVSLQKLNQKCKKKAGVYRMTRSEGRESIASMGLVISHYLEFSTMTICTNDYNFMPAGIDKMTKEGGISMSRGRRALGKYAKAGLIKTTLQFKKTRDTYQALNAIREVTPKFFAELGLSEIYNREKHYKAKKLEKRDSRRNFKGLLAGVGRGAGFVYYESLKALREPFKSKNKLREEYEKLCRAYLERTRQANTPLADTLFAIAQKLATVKALEEHIGIMRVRIKKLPQPDTS